MHRIHMAPQAPVVVSRAWCSRALASSNHQSAVRSHGLVAFVCVCPCNYQVITTTQWQRVRLPRTLCGPPGHYFATVVLDCRSFVLACASRSLRFVVMGHGVARASCRSLDCRRSRRRESRGAAVYGRVGLLVGVACARERGLSPLTGRNSYPARSCSWFVWDGTRAYLRVAASRFAPVGSSIWLVVRDAAPRWRVGWGGLGVARTQARFCYTRRNGAPLARDDRFAWHDTRASLAVGRVTPM